MPAGVSKRKYDVVVHTDTSQTKAYDDNAEEDLLEPFDIFEDRMLRKGNTIRETEQRFRDIVENPQRRVFVRAEAVASSEARWGLDARLA